MEADRYQQNHVAYISGLICLFSSLGLFAFSLFLVPYLFFDWQYNVPAMVTDFSTLLQAHYTISKSGVTWVICFALNFPAVILFIIADILSNRIDKKIYGIQRTKKVTLEQSATQTSKSEPGTGKLVFTLILLIIIIFMVAQFFHWVISTNG